MSIPPTPPSPGVGVRRKGPKILPRLPLSAFSPPNSGTSERFPLPPSPSAIHPELIIDAHILLAGGDLSSWRKEAGSELSGRIGGVVVGLPETDPEKFVDGLAKESGIDVLALMVPFKLEAPPAQLPSFKFPISLRTTFSQADSATIAGLNWALSQGRPVDIDASTLTEEGFEGFEDLLSKAVAGLDAVPPIIISSILPPPHDLELSIVKLINHPTYRAFQAQTAALSLFPELYVKFLPPMWDAPTPSTPSDGVSSDDSNSKQQKEWKRRVKMYLGPVVEAFGYQRIMFGSSPSPASTSPSAAGDWYDIARESLAELGVEQEFVDAVFYGNAKRVYA